MLFVRPKLNPLILLQPLWYCWLEWAGIRKMYWLLFTVNKLQIVYCTMHCDYLRRLCNHWKYSTRYRFAVVVTHFVSGTLKTHLRITILSAEGRFTEENLTAAFQETIFVSITYAFHNCYRKYVVTIGRFSILRTKDLSLLNLKCLKN